MAKLSTLFNDQTFIPGTGTPASGYKLFTYAAGSSTKQTTYTDAAGTTPQSNPIILNSSGWPTMGPIWQAAGSTLKFVLAPPTDTDPPTSPVKTIDNIPGLNDTSSTVTQWAASLVTPTYISATSFSLIGDQTTEFHVGRRVQFTTTAGTVYGTILTSVFTTLTTVTMMMDSGQVLDVGLSVVNLSILRNDHLATPRDTGPLNERHGADIASAATINLDAATGNIVDVTGTTTITAITLADGAERVVRFTGILTFTNGTSLILEGGANITTAPGDFAILRGYAGGVVRCVKYIRINGRAVAAGIDFDGVVPMGITTIWTRATAAGKAIYLNAAGATTQTFPLANTMVGGQAVLFTNFGAGLATFARQGADVFSGLFVGNTSFVLNQGESALVYTDAGGTWFVNFFNGATGLIPRTWQNLTASRASGTTYTNSTGRDIGVSVWTGNNASVSANIVVNGVTAASTAFSVGGAIGTVLAFAVVQNGATYSATTSGGFNMAEWR